MFVFVFFPLVLVWRLACGIVTQVPINIVKPNPELCV